MPTEVDRHTQECVEQADSGVLPTNSLEEVVERLVKHGSADYEHIRCDYFGIHSMDRSTFGMDPYAMNSPADKIDLQGSSLKKCNDATAIEAPIDTEENRKDVKANERDVDCSNGLLPPLTGLHALSIGGASPNGMLRAVRAKCLTTIARCADESGRWDRDEMVTKTLIWEPQLSMAFGGLSSSGLL